VKTWWPKSEIFVGHSSYLTTDKEGYVKELKQFRLCTSHTSDFFQSQPLWKFPFTFNGMNGMDAYFPGPVKARSLALINRYAASPGSAEGKVTAGATNNFVGGA
jgi:hypothetical protein